jgi:hypothetical protein
MKRSPKRKRALRQPKLETEATAPRPTLLAPKRKRSPTSGGQVEGAAAKHHLGKRARGGQVKRVDGGSLLRAVGSNDPTRGLGMVLGMPGDVYNMLGRGYQYALTKGAEKLGLIRPDEGAEMRKSLPAEKDASLGSAVVTRYLSGLSGNGAEPSDDSDSK